MLAESARAAFGKNVLGVMLTGMGADGASEFVKLKKLGGHIIAQDQASCVVYGMPRSLVEAGGCGRGSAARSDRRSHPLVPRMLI